MPRINPIDHATASGDAKKLLDAVKGSIGMVPNIFATMVQSSKVLEGFLAFNTALSQGLLSATLREQIALTVAGENTCDYCASAHSAIGKGAGLNQAELTLNLRGQSADEKVQTALTVVRKIVTYRGQIEDGDLEKLRRAGYSEGEIVEIVANVGINIFTNYFNHIAKTDIDFPLVASSSQTQAA
ncbi:carboxymuconolactone decarboxylase family protein [Kiloniella laminariae]|uniref:carboxymuconolactone decarboxylase family protein n=1 Tax=Kiloniella laminariae TaxID=454162 RepID=UPI000372999D|nr:carboxymuconolactone decarboxylase family protein [Kiloniella laminariae]